MKDGENVRTVGAGPLRRFWRTAAGFWGTPGAYVAWSLMAFLVVCIGAQLLVQYRLNLWNRDFFNAVEIRNAAQIEHLTLLLPALAAASAAIAVSAVWGRMTFQRRWRAWLTTYLLELWLADRRYRRIDTAASEPQFAEFRIADDARAATDAPIDFVVGLLTSTLTAATFVAVLWTVGGSLEVRWGGFTVDVPGYLVLCSVVYAGFVTGGMILVGHNMANVMERKNQAESEFKFALVGVREQEPSATLNPFTSIAPGFGEVLQQWRRLCGQHMRTTLVSHGNTLLAPLVGLILCVPKYIEGTMLLGEVTQAAAAFTMVQSAFNWLVDNYARLADWASSASRVGNLLLTLDALGAPEEIPPSMQALAAPVLTIAASEHGRSGPAS